MPSLRFQCPVCRNTLYVIGKKLDSSQPAPQSIHVPVCTQMELYCPTHGHRNQRAPKSLVLKNSVPVSSMQFHARMQVIQPCCCIHIRVLVQGAPSKYYAQEPQTLAHTCCPLVAKITQPWISADPTQTHSVLNHWTSTAVLPLLTNNFCRGRSITYATVRRSMHPVGAAFKLQDY